MRVMHRLVVLIVILTFGPLSGLVQAEGDSVNQVMQDWLNNTQGQESISPGTKITMQNWQQYKQFMPVGMVGFFEDKYFWKMPQDVAMNVGPTVIHPLSKWYLDATEKYGSQTRVAHMPDGTMNLQNYVAGMPFPNPQQPDLGYKILANVWFPNQPYLLVVSPQSGLTSFCTQDRFGSQSCTKTSIVYRQLAFNSHPDVPRTEPRAAGGWFTEWLMVGTARAVQVYSRPDHLLAGLYWGQLRVCAGAAPVAKAVSVGSVRTAAR